jgi:integrase
MQQDMPNTEAKRGAPKRINLTPAFVAKATPPATGDRAIFWDSNQPGFGLCVTAGGHRSFVCQYRNAAGKVRRTHLKDGLTLTDARKEARSIQGAVAKGGDPLGDKQEAKRAAKRAVTGTLRAVTEEYFKREGDKLRSIDQRRKAFDRLIFPRLGDRDIASIKRSEIVRLLDTIQDENGPRMAHLVLAYLSKLMNWHAGRDDDFVSPIVRGMGRVKASERTRKRTLSDDELRAVWDAAEASGSMFDRYVQFLLLTTVRRTEASHMTRAELSGADWIIPAARYKTKTEFLIPLSPAARNILGDMPAIGAYVFTSNGRRPLSGYSKFTADLQKRSGTAGWTLHDLRRTARSLMSRAGVEADHAERCLGHAIAGVRGTYDRHSFYAEKKAAFEALALQIDRILHPAANVFPFAAATEKRIPITAG